MFSNTSYASMLNVNDEQPKNENFLRRETNLMNNQAVSMSKKEGQPENCDEFDVSSINNHTKKHYL